MDAVQSTAFQSFQDRVSLVPTTWRMHYVNLEPIHIGDMDILPSDSVHNLGVMMDDDFSMTTHVKKQVQSCFHSLRQMRFIRQSLTKATKILISRFICSQIDYCNAVFACQGQPLAISTRSYMLRIIWYLVTANTTSTVVLGDELYWLLLHIDRCVSFVLITYKAINDTSPR